MLVVIIQYEQGHILLIDAIVEQLCCTNGQVEAFRLVGTYINKWACLSHNANNLTGESIQVDFLTYGFLSREKLGSRLFA